MSIKINRKCKNCEWNFDGICAGHSDVYKYGTDNSSDRFRKQPTNKQNNNHQQRINHKLANLRQNRTCRL